MTEIKLSLLAVLKNRRDTHVKRFRAMVLQDIARNLIPPDLFDVGGKSKDSSWDDKDSNDEENDSEDESLSSASSSKAQRKATDHNLKFSSGL